MEDTPAVLKMVHVWQIVHVKKNEVNYVAHDLAKVALKQKS
jgi:hypothetical protein